MYWTPRIFSVFFILFLALFSLDAGSFIGFLIHNIPVIVLSIVLAISWKYEIVGGIVFILAGLLYIFMLAMNPKFEWYMLSWSVTIAGPAFFIGVLFLIGWRKKRYHKK